MQTDEKCRRHEMKTHAAIKINDNESFSRGGGPLTYVSIRSYSELVWGNRVETSR